MKKNDYKLVHISGFCNLIYIRGDIDHPFSTPKIKDEITDTSEKVDAFCKKYCLDGFIPSWSSSEYLQNKDLTLLKELK